jgi:hypothetical protein
MMMEESEWKEMKEGGEENSSSLPARNAHELEESIHSVRLHEHEKRQCACKKGSLTNMKRSEISFSLSFILPVSSYSFLFRPSLNPGH